MSKLALDDSLPTHGKMRGGGPIVAAVATMHARDAIQDCFDNAENGPVAQKLVSHQSRLCDVARSLAIRRWMFENV